MMARQALDAEADPEEEKKEQEQMQQQEAVNRLLVLGKIAPPFKYEALTKLDLFQCGISSLPSSLPDVLPNLGIMFCMKNKFTEMPAAVRECKKLQMVSFKSNELTTIHPDALGPQLRWLILTDNRLETLPSTIGRCTILQKLMLSGNKLKSMPDEISSCKNLELVRLASNQLTEPPMALLRLPNLAWIALSDNPFLASQKSSINDKISGLEVIDDPALDDPNCGEVLGTGASGITHRKTHNGVHVAVKSYVGWMTSDGNPEEERKISFLASSLGCDCLIQVMGQTKSGALVMELLNNYSALASPPSLTTCSRDVYEEGASMTSGEAITLVSGLLDALAKLHSTGICHGDFYGHNILVPGDMQNNVVKLSDFGAAFLYDGSSEYGQLIATAEKRAFGHLVEEIGTLMKRSEGGYSSTTARLLADLAQLCFSPSSTFSVISTNWCKAVSEIENNQY